MYIAYVLFYLAYISIPSSVVVGMHTWGLYCACAGVMVQGEDGSRSSITKFPTENKLILMPITLVLCYYIEIENVIHADFRVKMI